MWNPGTTNGNPVAMENEVSISFYIHSIDEMIKMANDYQQKGNKFMIVKNNPEKALKFYNKAITLLPGEETLLAMRGLCKYNLNDKNGALTDWNRLKTLSGRNYSTPNFENLAQNIIASEGYSEMLKTINK